MEIALLFDSNAFIAWMSGDKSLLEVAQDHPTRLFLPVIAYGELAFGTRNSMRPTENEAALRRALADFLTLHTNDTAWEYAQVRLRLRARGRPIPENDIWIAALAIQHGLPLVTRDAHFDEVEKLDLVRW